MNQIFNRHQVSPEHGAGRTTHQIDPYPPHGIEIKF